jgi:hypothetical protein
LGIAHPGIGVLKIEKSRLGICIKNLADKYANERITAVRRVMMRYLSAVATVRNQIFSQDRDGMKLEYGTIHAGRTPNTA